MSFYDRLLLWFHVAFVIFTIGPVTLAVMASPRAIRTRNVPVLRYLSRMTVIFGAATLGVIAFGMILGQSLNELTQVWLTVAITLFVVAFVLLVVIMRDQRRAINALEGAAEEEAFAAAEAGTAGEGAAGDGEPGAGTAGAGTAGASTAGAPPSQATQPGGGAHPGGPAQIANVERGRIASMGGIVGLLWLAILVLMIWRP